MKTTVKEENQNIVMALEGRLDTGAAAQVKSDMQVLYDNEDRDIILDCEKLEYISSSGLRLFLALMKDAKTKGNHVIIANPSEELREVFVEVGFSSLFEIR